MDGGPFAQKFDTAEVAFRTIIDMMPNLQYVKKIRFVLYSDKYLEIHEKTLSRLLRT